MTFRQKLYLSYFVVFVIFLILLFPFASNVVDRIVKRTLALRTTQMIHLASTATDENDLIQLLESRKPYLFYRVSLITPEGKLLYDSYARPHDPDADIAAYLKQHPEITEAAKTGIGYGEGYSNVLGQELLYVARGFDFHGKVLIIRTAYPLRQIHELTEDFELGFLGLGVIVLLLFSLMTALITYHLSRPIQRIIRAITPYQEGEIDRLPEIKLGKPGSRDEFQRLADTLNSLNRHVEHHIETLETERNEKVAILESLIEGVVAVDTNMKVTHANRTALQMLKMDRHELVGHQFIISGQKEFNKLLLNCQQQRTVITSTAELGTRKPIYLDVIAVPMKIESGAVLILQDKSLTYRALEMRKEFIAHASHELKTPITIVRGFAEALHDNPEIAGEMLGDITEKIVRNCDRMERLVKNLLRLADIEHLPHANLRPTDLPALLESCKQMVFSVYPDAEIEIDNLTNQPVHLVADSDLLELAVMNLLENAAKYSTDPREIWVKVDSQGDEIILTISDNGMGIPAEDLPEIFGRFYTVDKSHSRRMGGCGLGLSLVETIIQKHLGTIEVTSELGKGTTFTIKLPKDLEKSQ